MPNVPRPERTPEQSEADQLRELLAVIVDALDVPRDAGATVAERDRIVSDRATVVKSVVRLCSGPVLPTDPAAWLRELLAEYAPEVPGE